jgi:hypothetical protein
MKIKCCICGQEFDEEDIIWVTSSGFLSVDKGNPYCMGCCPEEPEEYYENDSDC